MLFLLPGLAVLVLTYLFPLIYSLVLSFSEWDIRKPGSRFEPVGFDNYADILTDSDFWAAGWRSTVYSVVSLPIQLVLGTLIAVLLTSPRVNSKLGAFTRITMLIPLMLPPVVLGILWRLILNVNYGPANHILGLVGFGPLSFVSSAETALATAIFVEVLANTSVVVMILIGGILALPPDPLRAAEVDGAGPWRILLEIKLPQLASYYLIIILIRVMDLLKTFDFIYALTGGGPGSSTIVFNLFIYREGQRFLNYPGASAASWVFLVALLPLSFWLLRKAVRPTDTYLND